ncbi:hepatocyte growth factor receptor-like [Saccostrea echinata]|uniref:hepatocyte growth factor receptor-like n=1 Tax=Saccostrea echinata TaxID=191078 RepID=UPI002A837068|nr:hepatocyte growth factor receptor-like [Saccostrea echinata]
MEKKIVVLCCGVFLLLEITRTQPEAAVISHHVDQGSIYEIMVHPDTGDIYLGAKNVLLHLRSDLLVLGGEVMGPWKDNQQCSPDPTGACSEGRIPTSNQVNILAYDKGTGYMLVCGSIWQGKCELRDTRNISRVLKLTNSKTNFVGSINKRHVFAFYGSKPVGGGGDLLYVAMGMDGRPPQYQPAAISTRDYQAKDREFKYYINGSMYHTYVDVHSDLIKKFKAYYIYGFEYENHTYFISVQMEDALASTPRYLTKIIQICQKDKTYASYTELPLQCMSNSVVYDIAIDAYYNPSLANDLSSGLAVTFGRTSSGSDADPSLGSVLCFYDILDIVQKFEELQYQCFSEGVGSQVTWLVGKSLSEVRNCERDMNYVQKDFCGLLTNIGIQESATSQNRDQFKLSHDSLYHVPDKLLTSVVMVIQNKERVAVLGTNTGQVAKVSIFLQRGRYLTSWSIADKAISSQSELDRSQAHVFLIADQTLYKFPLYICDGYTTCEACVGSRDPTRCGWCVDHCSTQNKCVNPPQTSTGQQGQWQNDTCPPVISQVTPSAGPIQGQTLLTLQGRNFGSARATEVMVSLNGSDCKIQSKGKNDTMLQCRTPPSQSPGTAFILLTVKDNTHKGYKISGTSASAQFHYQVPVITGISPTLGPVSGGTSLTISGENLDIGSDLSVFIGEAECSVQRKQHSSILCLTGHGMVSSEITYKTSALEALYPSLVTAAYVTVQIDNSHTNSSQMFAYVNDSTITSIQPKTSIVDGGLEIVVRGKNLNVVQHPQIGATVDGKNADLRVCKATANGTIMICPSPSIQGLLSEPVDPEIPKIVSIWFKMDGIKELRELDKHSLALSRFTYYPSPTFEQFMSVRQFDLSEDLLTIKGEHIDKGITPRDVIVTIGNSLCVVKLLQSNLLYCKPQNKPLETEDSEPYYPVQVKVGVNLTFDIGNLQYVGGPSSQSPTLIIVIAIVLAIIIIVIIVLIIIYKKRCGPFTKKGYTAGYANGQGQVQFHGLSNPDGTTFDFERDNRANDYQERHLSESRDDGADLSRGDTAAVVLDESTVLVLRDKNLLIEHDWLSMGEILGRGHFGCVYKGYITYPGSKTETMVAVKTLHQNSPREIDISQFIDEALRMKDFHHPNVLTLIGICFNYDAMPLVILPYMEHGDLLTYIRNENNNPTIKDLILFAVDIAKGMEYLSLLKVVHRDLACRNCMLNEEYRAIVADFGLSRDIYERDYYSSDNKKSKLPVKWMAPESLEKGTYSSKSDVWSFGVVLWELMTRGVNPYPEVDNWDVLRYIKKNRRMPQPPFCPDPLYTVMRNCWEFDPNNRPQFSELVTSIKEMLVVLEHKMKQGQHRSNIQSTYVNTENCTDYHYGNQEEEEKSPLASPIQTDV